MVEIRHPDARGASTEAPSEESIRELHGRIRSWQMESALALSLKHRKVPRIATSLQSGTYNHCRRI